MDGANTPAGTPLCGIRLGRSLANMSEGAELEARGSEIRASRLFNSQDQQIAPDNGTGNGGGAESVSNTPSRRSSLCSDMSTPAPDHGATTRKDNSVDNTPQKLPAVAARTAPMTSPEIRKIRNLERMEDQFEQGCDSDGNEPPPGTSDDIDFNKEEVRPIDRSVEEEKEEEPPINVTPRHIEINEVDLVKLTLPQIKHQLTIRGAQFKGSGPGGRKDELMTRLRLALNKKIPVSTFMTPEEIAEAKRVNPKKKATTYVDDLAGFAPGSHWTPLVPQEEAVSEPDNTIPNARAPTVPETEGVPIKHNYAERFDRPVFAGRKNVPKMYANGRPQTGPTGNQIYTKATRENLETKAEFLRKHHLNSDACPIEFADAFLPWHENPYNTKFFSMDQCTTYSNLKAGLSNAGAGGTNYKDFKPFSCKEMRQFLGLYVLNGLTPSPRMEMKFKPQAVDPVQGNDFVYRNMGGNTARRWRHFKCFFALQDPRKDPPDRKKHPLFKVQRIVNWINFLGQKVVLMGMHCSVDEQTIGFQGRHGDKMRITFKKVGDGFQCDVICDSGFTYCCYFRNVPPPPEYVKAGQSTLHARVLWLFDHLEDKFHRVWMDNLYLSASFARACFNHPKKVMIAGVTRKGGRGLPVSILQEEKNTKTEEEKVRGTVKAAVLNGDPLCPSLVAVSVYDTKPVHFLSMTCEEISWMKKERRVFNVDTNRMEPMNFLRLNVNDSYNMDMGHVDVSDQLRDVYKFNVWLRNYKWWWSIFQWGMGVLLVNAYVNYKKALIADGKTPMSHYDFRRTIALSWIDSGEPSIAERRRERIRQATPGTPHSNKRTRATLDMSNVTSTKRKRTTPPSGTSNATATSNSSKPAAKSSHLNDQSIDNASGPFAKRLDRFVDHFPVMPTERRPYCALHRCVGKLDERKHVYKCSHCKINLCIDCHQIFHTQVNVKEKKEHLRMMMASKKKLRLEEQSMEQSEKTKR